MGYTVLLVLLVIEFDRVNEICVSAQSNYSIYANLKVYLGLISKLLNILLNYLIKFKQEI